MKRLFLASSIDTQVVANDIFHKLGKTAPLKTLCIGTATEDRKHEDLSWYEDDKASLRGAGFSLIDFTISGKSKTELEEALDSVDVVFVSGGNTFYLLQESQKTGFLEIIQKKVTDGLAYIGSSAGSVIAGPDIDPILILDKVEYARDIQGYRGYNLVDFCVLPHWGSENFRELYLKNKPEHIYQEKWQLIPLTNNQYVEVRDDWYQIVDVTKE